MDEKRDTTTTQSGKNDSSEYSASKAPETRREAEETESVADPRLIPGGRHGAPVDIGMSAMDRSDVPNGALDTGQTRYRDTPDGSV
jgi:hypothetical protein